MARPRSAVTITDSGPARSSNTDSGVWFAAGITEKGPESAVAISNMSEYERILGERTTTTQIMYDSADTFFAEGGRTFYASRVLGDAAAVATRVLVDGSAANALRVNAVTKGAWGNKLNIEVVAGSVGGSFVLVVSHDDDGELERSPDLVDQLAALAWAANSGYIRLVQMTSALDPAVAGPFSLASGADDLGSVLDADWADAIDRFSQDLGTGQVSMPGRTTTQAHVDVLAHANANNRTALLDGADSPTASVLATAAATVRAAAGSPANRHGGLFAPWATIPGVAAGTTRTVPYSAVQAGLIAVVDSSHSPADPAAGALGHSRYAIGLSQAAWSDPERDTLNDAGVNVARIVNGDVVTYGYRSLADPVNDPDWLALAEVRMVAEIAAVLDEVGERFVLRKVDGRKHSLSEFGGEITGALIPFWLSDSLYGATASEAFSVNVGPLVNTVDSIAAGFVKAAVGVRVSPTGEQVLIDVVKKRITEAVA